MVPTLAIIIIIEILLLVEILIFSFKNVKNIKTVMIMVVIKEVRAPIIIYLLIKLIILSNPSWVIIVKISVTTVTR